MAPDLNSVPSSPRNLATTTSSAASSRRVSHATGSAHASTGMMEGRNDSVSMGPMHTSSGTSSIGSGPGPLRHPRPLTAAELHLELEKEQEAIVNRLTRELAALRQQTASVVSTASSASTGAQEHHDPTSYMVQGPVHSTDSRRHRSSSNLSAHSVGLGALTTVSGIAPARDAPNVVQPRTQLHRQDSMTSRRSEAPSASSSFSQGDSFQGGVSLRQSQGGVSSGPPSGGMRPVSPTDARHPQRTVSTGSSRFEEITHQRAELEKARQENEALRRRVQELEHRLNAHGGATTESTPEGTGQG